MDARYYRYRMEVVCVGREFFGVDCSLYVRCGLGDDRELTAPRVPRWRAQSLSERTAVSMTCATSMCWCRTYRPDVVCQDEAHRHAAVLKQPGALGYAAEKLGNQLLALHADREVGYEVKVWY